MTDPSGAKNVGWAEPKTKPNKVREVSPKPRRFSLELVIVIAIPLLTIIASLVTLAIAQQLGFSAGEAPVDRFGRAVETQQEEQR